MAYEGPKGPQTPAWKIAKTYNFSPSDDTWSESYEKPGPTDVVRLANVQDRICAYFEYTEEY